MSRPFLPVPGDVRSPHGETKLVVVLDNTVATQPVTGLVSLTGANVTTSVVALGVLASQTNRSLVQPDGNNLKLTVGETFSISGTTDVFTMRGSGTLSALNLSGSVIGTSDVLVAYNETQNRFVFVYPNNDPPGLLSAVGVRYNVSEVGYRFSAPVGILCFARGTMIETPEGPRAIETLARGDLVLTKDQGVQPIAWMGSQLASAKMLVEKPNLRPIRIKAGALGDNLPAADLIVSPQHRILVRSKIAQKMFGTSEVLVAAKQLLLLDGIDIAEDMESVEYFHIMFDRHEVIVANGAEAESLFTGPEAMKAVGPAAREEILTLFPQLADESFEAVAARTLATGRTGRRMAQRHAQNRRALVQ